MSRVWRLCQTQIQLWIICNSDVSRVTLTQKIYQRTWPRYFMEKDIQHRWSDQSISDRKKGDRLTAQNRPIARIASHISLRQSKLRIAYVVWQLFSSITIPSYPLGSTSSTHHTRFVPHTIPKTNQETPDTARILIQKHALFNQHRIDFLIQYDSLISTLPQPERYRAYVNHLIHEQWKLHDEIYLIDFEDLWQTVSHTTVDQIIDILHVSDTHSHRIYRNGTWWNLVHLDSHYIHDMLNQHSIKLYSSKQWFDENGTNSDFGRTCINGMTPQLIHNIIHLKKAIDQYSWHITTLYLSWWTERGHAHAAHFGGKTYDHKTSWDHGLGWAADFLIDHDTADFFAYQGMTKFGTRYHFGWLALLIHWKLKKRLSAERKSCVK